MVRSGVLGKRRVALIEGVIVEMHAQGEPHWLACHRTARLLERVFGPGFVVRQNASFVVGRRSVPEPDLLVFRGEPEDVLVNGPPTSAELVVEVSQTSLNDDRTEMARLYASAGVPEYWIVNLVDRQLEVRRDPDVARQEFRDVGVVRPGERVLPLRAPQGADAIDAARMLPLFP